MPRDASDTWYSCRISANEKAVQSGLASPKAQCRDEMTVESENADVSWVCGLREQQQARRLASLQHACGVTYIHLVYMQYPATTTYSAQQTNGSK